MQISKAPFTSGFINLLRGGTVDPFWGLMKATGRPTPHNCVWTSALSESFSLSWSKETRAYCLGVSSPDHNLGWLEGNF